MKWFKEDKKSDAWRATRAGLHYEKMTIKDKDRLYQIVSDVMRRHFNLNDISIARRAIEYSFKSGGGSLLKGDSITVKYEMHIEADALIDEFNRK